jgi:competence protein ComEC
MDKEPSLSPSGIPDPAPPATLVAARQSRQRLCRRLRAWLTLLAESPALDRVPKAPLAQLAPRAPFELNLVRGAPLGFGAAALAAGILLREHMSMPALAALVSAAVLLAPVLAGKKRIGRLSPHPEWTMWTLAFLAAIALGAARHSLSFLPLPAGHIGLSPGLDSGIRKATVTGTLDGEPAINPDAKTTTFRIVAAKINARPVSGLIRVTLRWPAPELRYGDTVRVRGTLFAPRGPGNPGQSDYRAVLARQGVYAVMSVWDPKKDFALLSRNAGNPVRAALTTLRRAACARISALVGEPEAGVLSSIVFGFQAGLDPDVVLAFRLTGLIHILVASGLNVGLLAYIVLTLLSWFGIPKRRAALITVPVLGAYLLLCGAEPPLTRATVMFVLLVGASVLGRADAMLNALGAAAAGILLAEPGVLLDPSFQLSFGATFGVMALAPALIARRGPVPKIVAEAASCTIAAQAALLPILAAHFASVPFLGALANLFVTPLMGFFLSGGLVLLVLGWIPVAGHLMGAGMGLAMKAVLAVVDAFARVPLASVVAPPFPPAALAAYAAWAVGGLLWLTSIPAESSRVSRFASEQKGPEPLNFARRVTRDGSAGSETDAQRETNPPSLDQTRDAIRVTRDLPVWPRYLCLAGALGLAVSTWRAALAPSPGNLMITFLDVGQGLSAVIRLPSGRTVLYDAGPPFAGPVVVAPFLKRSGCGRLAAAVLSHADDDHSGGLAAVLRQVSSDRVVFGVRQVLPDAITEAARATRTTASPVSEGFELTGEPGVHMVFLNPPARPDHSLREDDYALVLAVEYGDTAALLTADVSARTEARLLRAGGDADLLDGAHQRLLQVPHHGSLTASSPAFLASLAPVIAVVSAGAHNRFGHPHPAVVIRYRDVGALLLRTDLVGAITVTSAGGKWTASAHHPPPAAPAKLAPLATR